MAARSSELSSPLAQRGTKLMAFALCAAAFVATGCGAATTDGLGIQPEAPGPDAGDDDIGDIPVQLDGASGFGFPSGGIGGLGGVAGSSGAGGVGGTVTQDAGITQEGAAACRALWGRAVGACVVSGDDAVGDAGASEPFSGIVESIDRDGPLCQQLGSVQAPDSSYSFTVRDGERVRVVTLQLPWSTPLVELGATIQIEHSFEQGMWSPSIGRLEIRAADESVLLWLEQASAGPLSLKPPAGISVADGPTQCSFDAICGDSTRKSLLVSSGGAQGELAFGAAASVGDYVFLHGDNTDFEFTGGCTDTGSVHTVLIAAVRGSLDSLAARDIGPCGGGQCGASQYCAVPGAAQCDGQAADAACTSRPVECEVDCPLVCGCDGKLYCSACRAHQAGVAVNEADTSCMAAGCTGEDGIAMAGPCTTYWTCYGRNYGVSCAPVGDVQRCRCSIDNETITTIDTADAQCADAIALCGFPPLPF